MGNINPSCLRDAELISVGPVFSIIWDNKDTRSVLSISDNISHLGYSPADLICGKINYSDIVYSQDLEKLNEDLGQFQKDHKKSYFSTGYRIQANDGRICEVIEKTFKILQDGSGLLHGLVFVTRNPGSKYAIIEQENNYCKHIVDSIQNSLLILDNTLHVLSANRYFYEIFKTFPEKIEGRLFFDIYGRNWDRPQLKLFLERLLVDNIFFDNLEIDCNVEDLGSRTMRFAGRILDIGMDSNRHILLSIEDITVQRKAEMELKAFEEKYSTLVEKGNDGIIIIYDETLSFVNSKFSQMTDFNKNDINGRNLLSLVPLEYHRMISKRLKKVLKDKRGIRRNDEIEFLKMDGTAFPAEISISYILHEYRPSVMMAVRDISERKKTEAELKASEEKYSTLVEKGNDGIIIIQDEIFKFANSKFSELTGYSREELQENEFMDHVPIDYQRMISKRIKKVLKDRHSIRRNNEIEFIKKNGDAFPAEISLSFIVHEEKPSVMMAVRDISERKLAEAEIKASEKKYSTLVEEGNDGIIVVQDEVLVFANMKFCEITGFSRAEILHRSFEDFLSLEYKRLVMNKFKRSLEKNRKASLKYEIEFVSKEGKNTPAEINSSIIDHEGRPAIMAIIRDITDQKQKEKELLELIEVQKVLETVIKSSPAVVFFWKPDEEWRVEFVSENISQFGYEADELMSGKVLYGDIIHPSDMERLTLEYDIFSGEDNLSFEYRILTKSGEVRWVDERSVLKRDAEGNLQYIQGIIVDITERKNVKNFMQIGSDMGILFSPLGDVGDMFSQLVEFTSQMDNLDCGALYLVDEMTGDMNIVAHSGLSSDFIKSTRHYGGKSIHSRLLKTEYPLYTRYYELMSMTPGDKLSYEGLEATALIPVRYGMEPVAILMLASHSAYEVPFDVRESLEAIASQIGPVIGRMREQADVQRDIRNLQVIFESMTDLVFMLDNDGCILYANPYSCKRLGYSENEVVSMSFLNLYPQKRFLEAASVLKDILSGKAHVCTIPFESSSKEIISVEMRCSLGQLNENPVTICVSREYL
ncbi:PAS domain S-box protein [Methanolobus psychrotolerans]|uniref:PAS domain S-box protein n=1 Tax=Methanolobus psychrotolerans TaxID=1874706 RepID=UPI0013EDED13|nr:PAS domain S-box protein [Methanolobus psychrotolerans]